MTESIKEHPDFIVPDLEDFGEKTFLGGGSLYTRTVLFFVFGVLALLAFTAVLFIADKKTSAAQERLASSQELMVLAGLLEKSALRVRVDEKNFLLHNQSQYVINHKMSADTLAEVLNIIYNNAASAPIKEHITTINEGIGQYTAEFKKAISAGKDNAKIDALRGRLRKAELEAEIVISGAEITLLQETFVSMRRYEKSFIQRGDMRDVVKFNKSAEEFTSLLASSPLSPAKRTLISNMINAYQGSMSEFIKIRLKRERLINRLDEIFAYITPSINGLVSYARDNNIKTATEVKKLRASYARSLPAGGAAILIAIMLFGVAMMRSITSPVSDVGSAARRMAAGEDNVEIPALGNNDEIGDIARTLFKLRMKFAEMTWLDKADVDDSGGLGGEESDAAMAEVARMRAELLAANEKIKKAEAVMSEAIQLRVDMEAMKIEAGKGAAAIKDAEILRNELDNTKKESAKGEAALIEAALLRIDLEATKAELEGAVMASKEAKKITDVALLDNQSLSAPPDEQAAETGQVLAKSLPGQIRDASNNLAHSSQSVSAAADEAERIRLMIKGLANASQKIATVDVLLGNISHQTNFLVPQQDALETMGVSADRADSNLVVLTSDYKKAANKSQNETTDEAIGERFDAIRATTNQAAWTIKDVANAIDGVNKIACEISASSSADALEITTDLLDQSKHLRKMLDDLVANIQDDTTSG